MNGKVGFLVAKNIGNFVSDWHRRLKRRPIEVSEFETRRWPYYAALPLMWILTLWVMLKKTTFRFFGKQVRCNSIWFDGLGRTCRVVKDGAASWVSLNEIYNYQFGQTNGLKGRISDFWEGMMNAQAVRNRLKVAKQQLREAISQFIDKPEVRILSLAAGSAQSVLEVMTEFKKKGVLVRSILVDIDPTAISYAEKLSQQLGVGNQIKTVRANVACVARVAKYFRPQIVEMMGLLDYIKQDKAIRLVTKIREILPANGIFLTCNIRKNPERHFLKWVINWPMIYRTPDELAEVISESCFEEYTLIYEPLKIHGIAVARKTGIGKTPG